MLINNSPRGCAAQAPLKSTSCLGGCGKIVRYKTNPRTYCSECKLRVRRERSRVAMEKVRRDRGVAAVKGTSIHCVKCARPFVRNGIRARYCDQCKRSINLQTARASSKARWASVEGRLAQNEWFKEYRKRNPTFRVSRHMTVMIGRSLKSGKQGRGWKSFVPYTLDELMRHLERQFLPGMGWDNKGEWHIDHIRPISSFQFDGPSDPAFREAWALTNLRPLWGKDNIRKQAKRLYLI